MARTAVAVVIVLGLAAGVWWLLPSDDPAPSTTLPVGAATTTTGTSTSTTVDGSVSTSGSDHVVTTVEEAEEILRALWFGWFEGIYNQDEDRIREVVATEEQVETAKEQFGVMEFTAAPTPEAIVFTETEILRSDEECLAVWSVTHAEDLLGESATTSGVEVLRWRDDHWVMLSSWVYREDLWQSDCQSLLP
jgi:hypothetical protein